MERDAGLTAGLTTAPGWLLPLDDAYIFVRYAQQAARGRPLQWTDGQPSTGSSSFLFPLLLVPGQLVADDLPGWSRWSRGIGVASLGLLGLASLFWFRRVGCDESWAVAGAIAVVWSGPIGFSSVSGMETGLAAACVVFACARWDATGPSSPWDWLLIALLPLVRPELFALTATALVVAIVARSAGFARTAAVLAPTAAYVAINLATTHQLGPAGATAKSQLGAPFVTPGLLADHALAVLGRKLPTLYLGLEGAVLWAPVGIAGVAVVGWTVSRWATRRPGRPPLDAAVTTFLLLVAAAPLSTHLEWQSWRHHQPALVLCWLFAIVAAERTVRRFFPRPAGAARYLAPIGLVGLVALGVPHWSNLHRSIADHLAARHGPVVEALARSDSPSTVLAVTDAGLPALAHDGPMIDLMGLGTPELTRPTVHGSGAVAEALARFDPLPRLAAVNLDLEVVPPMLGRPLVRVRDVETQTVLAEVETGLFERTVLDRPGVDVGHLESEDGSDLAFAPPPARVSASLALALTAPGGSEVTGAAANATAPRTIQGCRPVYGLATITAPAEARRIVVVAASTSDQPTSLEVSFGTTATVELRLPDDGRWHRVELATGRSGGGPLSLHRTGPGVPCLESISWSE